MPPVIFNAATHPSPFIDLAIKRAEELSKTYRCVPHPLQYYYIDPNHINYRTRIHNDAKNKFGLKTYDICTLKDGDWDTHRGLTVELHYDTLYNAVYERYYKGTRWEDTPLIEIKMKEIEKLGRVDGCSNREELIRRYNRLDEVFLDISKNGFRRQDEIKGGKIFEEMFVTIGRYGVPFLASGGNHRLAIAKLLRIKSVPFLFMTRHLLWQRAKESYYDYLANGIKPQGSELDVAVLLGIVKTSFDAPPIPA